MARPSSIMVSVAQLMRLMKPGDDGQTGGVDFRGAREIRKVTHRGDGIPRHRHIRHQPRAPAPVEDRPASDQEIVVRPGGATGPR